MPEQKEEGLVEIYARVIKELEVQLAVKDLQIEEMKKEIQELRSKMYV